MNATRMTTSTAGQEAMRELYASLSARRRPEDVAETIRELLGDSLTRQEAHVLETAARGSLARRIFGYTSMAQEFARPVGADRQVARASELFRSAYPLNGDLCSNPDAVEAFIRAMGQEIGKVFGQSDYRDHRLTHGQRKELGMELSRRGYNKRFRLLARMEAKLQRLVREIRKRELQMVGKSGLASRLSWDEFAADPDAAAFAAYYTARRNLRSEFTISGQQRAYDEVAAMLFARCERNPSAAWWTVAHVYPRVEIFRRLSERQAGELVGRWYGVLQKVAEVLEETWTRSSLDRSSMVVKRGDDSTTWNNTAGAWNTARDNWIGLLYALEWEDLLDRFLPGKAMRLIAGDVAAWHRAEGSPPDANLFVWNELPLPWRVLSGAEACTLPMVVEACRRHGLDPARSGWVAPRPHGAVAPFRPTPELVHGVTVANPFLADMLRKLGYFSGKPQMQVNAPV
ncbi:hypothetical protein [Longimicrobium sp.]|uniref:hypothetical protein n=1 Tax=Longimicrobium sp. TaxID=2029185 RepID=UPI003B3BC956